MADSTSAIAAQRLSAASCRSLPSGRSQSASAAASASRSGISAGGEKSPRLARNTCGVGRAMRGLASSRPQAGSSGAADRISPTPIIRAGRDATQTGTSAPSFAAIASSAAWSSPVSHSASSTRSAAAASAEPPPMPDATGSNFVSVIAAFGARPVASARARAARSTRLSGSPVRATASAPRISRVRSSAWPAVTMSLASAKTARLSSRW